MGVHKHNTIKWKHFLWIAYEILFILQQTHTFQILSNPIHNIQLQKHPSTVTALFSSTSSSSSNENELLGAGYGFEEYTTKRSSFEPVVTTPYKTNDETPWPNYYCTPDLNRTKPITMTNEPLREILTDENENSVHLNSILTSDQARFVFIWKGKNLVQHTKVFDNGNANSTKEIEAIFLPYEDRIHSLLMNQDTIICYIGAQNDKNNIPLHYFSLDISYMENDPTTSTPATSIFNPISDSSTYAFDQLRSIGGTITNDLDAGILATSRGLSIWHRSTLFCSKCGSSNIIPHKWGTGRKCQSCSSSFYPRIDPSMIALVTATVSPDTKDSTTSTYANQSMEYVLLGRKSIWPKGRYSILAGFTELGESLEESVIREVWEESGVKVDPSSISFFSSQPWPFPRSLMIGFRAKALSTTTCEELPPILIDEKEMEDIKWFSKQDVKIALDSNGKHPTTNTHGIQNMNIPGRASLAYKMLSHWIMEES